MRPIGIMGGTFDPVHYGHLRTGLEFVEQLGLAKLHLVPCHQPPHRDRPSAAPEHRMEMLRRALSPQEAMIADDRELRRDGPSWTIDTLRSLRAEYGPERSLCLLLGADAFAQLDTWQDWRQLLQFAHIVVAERPGAGAIDSAAVRGLLEAHETDATDAVVDSAAGRILRCRFTLLDISATVLRQHLLGGRTVRYLVPDAVIEYIEEQRLYRNASEDCQ